MGVNNAGNLLGWPAKAANTVANTDVVPEVAVANVVPLGQTTMAASSPVTIASDQSSVPHYVAPSSASAAAGTPKVAGASVDNLVACAAACNLQNSYITSSVAAWVFLINATSAPVNGTLTVGTASGNLQGCFELNKANTDWQGTINYNPGPWEQFSVGLTVTLSSTACPSLTKTANSVYLHAQVSP
jgi:hypothetical protein